MSGKGQRIGYVRVSSIDQNADRQLEHFHVEKLFTDKASGKDTNRPQLQALLAYVREGDTIVVHSMDRLARNVDDLRRIVHEQTRRGIRLQFIKENLIFTGDDSPMANLMLSILGASRSSSVTSSRSASGKASHWPSSAAPTRGRKKALPVEKAARSAPPGQRRREEGTPGPRIRHQPRDAVSILAPGAEAIMNAVILHRIDPSPILFVPCCLILGSLAQRPKRHRRIKTSQSLRRGSPDSAMPGKLRWQHDAHGASGMRNRRVEIRFVPVRHKSRPPENDLRP